jgi:hypothetical protein
MMYDHSGRFDSSFLRLHRGSPLMAISTIFNSDVPLLTSLKGPLVEMRGAGLTGFSSGPGGVGASYIFFNKHHLNSAVRCSDGATVMTSAT